MPVGTVEHVFDRVELRVKKDPRDAQTSGGMTDWIGVDMNTVPECREATLDISGVI